MSSTNKTTNYQLSQFVGTDIPSILNDYNGDMRKIDNAIHDASVAGGNNASAIAELQSTVGRHTTEISGINSSVNTISGRVVGIESKIPASASESNKLITNDEADSKYGKFTPIKLTGANVRAIILDAFAKATEIISEEELTESEFCATYCFRYGKYIFNFYNVPNKNCYSFPFCLDASLSGDIMTTITYKAEMANVGGVDTMVVTKVETTYTASGVSSSASDYASNTTYINDAYIMKR